MSSLASLRTQRAGTVRQQPSNRFYACFNPPPERGLLTALTTLNEFVFPATAER